MAQTLPVQALLPAIEERPGATFGVLTPQSTEELFQQIRGVQTLLTLMSFLGALRPSNVRLWWLLSSV